VVTTTHATLFVASSRHAAVVFCRRMLDIGPHPEWGPPYILWSPSIIFSHGWGARRKRGGRRKWEEGGRRETKLPQKLKPFHNSSKRHCCGMHGHAHGPNRHNPIADRMLCFPATALSVSFHHIQTVSRSSKINCRPPWMGLDLSFDWQWIWVQTQQARVYQKSLAAWLRPPIEQWLVNHLQINMLMPLLTALTWFCQISCWCKSFFFFLRAAADAKVKRAD